MNMFTFHFIILLYSDFSSNMCRRVGLFKGFPRITLEIRTLHSGIFFSVELSSHVGYQPSGAKKW